MRALFVTGAVIMALPATASADALSDELSKACKPLTAPNFGQTSNGVSGEIAVRDVRTLLLDHHKIDRGLLIDAGPGGAALRTMQAKVEVVDDRPLWELKRRVESWLKPFEERKQPAQLADDDVQIVDAQGGRLDPQDLERVLRILYAAQPEALRLQCRQPQAPPPPRQEAERSRPKPAWVLAKSNDDLALADIADKSFAEFSFTDDRQARVQSYGITLATGLAYPLWTTKTGDRSAPPSSANPWTRHARTVLPYLTYEREGANDPAVDGYTNNLNLGVLIAGEWEHRTARTWIAYYSLSYEHQTDDDFRASADAIEARFEPDLGFIPGQRVYYDLGSADAVTDTDIFWSFEAVADWTSISKPGEKAELVDGAEYARLGYDAGFKLRVGPADRPWRVIWSTLYQVRDGQSEDGGDAQLFSSDIKFALGKASPFSFGLSYERGENLQSFEESEIWKLTFGVRR